MHSPKVFHDYMIPAMETVYEMFVGTTAHGLYSTDFEHSDESSLGDWKPLVHPEGSLYYYRAADVC